LLPAFIVETALQRGELVTVLDDYLPPALSLNAVYPQHRQRSEVNRQLLAFLQARLAS
jgi:DNA-binding transcriptional LysR family regulator